MAKQQKKIRYDEFVSAVRPDPYANENLKVLEGFVGKSTMEGHCRLYLDESLNNFIEIPEDDIVFAVEAEKNESALGGSRLWVKENTLFTYGDPKLRNRPQSSFLEGDLMEAYQRSGARAAIGGINQISPAVLTGNLGCGYFVTIRCDDFATYCNTNYTHCFPNNSVCGGLFSVGCFPRTTVNDTCRFIRTIVTDPCRLLGTRPPCGLNYSTNPPTTWDWTTVVQTRTPVFEQAAQANPAFGQGAAGTGFQTYNPYQGY